LPSLAPSGYDAEKEDAVIELTENQRQELSRPDPSAALEETFRALADEWRAETEMHSSMSKKLRHPAYQKIIALGEPAIPLILRELRDRPGFWFEALITITRQSPVPPEERTDPRQARERWLNWGREKRYLE
jgi:hypothetical protein